MNNGALREIVWIQRKIDKFIKSIESYWKNEPLDGDETAKIAKLVLKSLNRANGN